MDAATPPHTDRPWAARLVEYVGLPEQGTVLCAGGEALSLARAATGHRRKAVALLGRGRRPEGAGTTPCLAAALVALPLRDRCLAAALCAGALGRRSHPEAALAELRRVLRPGGLLVVHEPLAPRPGGEHLTAAELCAHLAGERLAVLAHRQDVEGDGATWVLQVPESGPLRRRTFLEEDR